MSKLSKNAFAIMAMCEKTKEPFGITVDPREGCLAFAWTFKIKEESYYINEPHNHIKKVVFGVTTVTVK